MTNSSPTAGHQVAAHRLHVRVLGARGEPVHVGDGQRALRGGVRGAGGVPAEHRRPVRPCRRRPSPGRSGARSSRGRRRPRRGRRAVRRARRRSPASRPSSPAGRPTARSRPAGRPSRSAGCRPGRRPRRRGPRCAGPASSQKFSPRSRSWPQRGVEHALGRHHPAAADLLRRAVGHQGDLVPVGLQTEGELETGLAGSDDEYLAHGCLLKGRTGGSRPVIRSAGRRRQGVAAPAPAGPATTEYRRRASQIRTGMCRGIDSASRTSSSTVLRRRPRSG